MRPREGVLKTRVESKRNKTNAGIEAEYLIISIR